MSAVFRSGSQELPTVLERAHRFAVASGQTNIAAALERSQTRKVLTRVRRDPRPLKGILWLEGKLVESLLQLAHCTRDIGRLPEPPRNVHRFCKVWSRGVQTKLRRVPGGRGMPELARLLLVDATASLATCMGVAHGKRERVEVSRSGGVGQKRPVGGKMDEQAA
jgi:hypothetical protein